MKDTLQELKKEQTEILFNLRLISDICKAEKTDNILIEDLRLMEEQLHKDLLDIRKQIEDIKYNEIWR